MLASSRGAGRNVGRWYNFMMSLCGGIHPALNMIYGLLFILFHSNKKYIECAPSLYKRKG